MKKLSRKKKILVIVISCLAFLVAVRLALPYVLLRYLNHTPATTEGYYGHIRDIDLAIIRRSL